MTHPFSCLFMFFLFHMYDFVDWLLVGKLFVKGNLTTNAQCEFFKFRIEVDIVFGITNKPDIFFGYDTPSSIYTNHPWLIIDCIYVYLFCHSCWGVTVHPWPRIECPKDMTIDLPPGQRTVEVFIPQPATNVDYLRYYLIRWMNLDKTLERVLYKSTYSLRFCQHEDRYSIESIDGQWVTRNELVLLLCDSNVEAEPNWAKQLRAELGPSRMVISFRARNPVTEYTAICSFVLEVRGET